MYLSTNFEHPMIDKYSIIYFLEVYKCTLLWLLMHIGLNKETIMTYYYFIAIFKKQFTWE